MSNNVVCRHVLLPPTEEGKKLELTYEQEHLCKIVYKKTEDGEGYAFYGLWDPEQDITDPGEYIVAPLRSSYKGTFDYPKNASFANVIGSKDDHSSDHKSWIQVLTNILGPAATATCVMEDGYYLPNDTTETLLREKGEKHFCRGIMVGGHVIEGTVSHDLPKNSDAHILPICNRHNTYNKINGETGQGYYMKTKAEGSGIVVSGYIPSKKGSAGLNRF